MLGSDILAEPFECCETVHHHNDVLKNIENNLLSDDDFFAVADLFKMFGDSTRLKILYVLSEGELCVCDITNLVGITQSAVSHQLRVLKQARLIKFRRDGKTVYYSLADSHVKTILAQGIEHIEE